MDVATFVSKIAGPMYYYYYYYKHLSFQIQITRNFYVIRKAKILIF